MARRVLVSPDHNAKILREDAELARRVKEGVIVEQDSLSTPSGRTDKEIARDSKRGLIIAEQRPSRSRLA